MSLAQVAVLISLLSALLAWVGIFVAYRSYDLARRSHDHVVRSKGKDEQIRAQEKRTATMVEAGVFYERVREFTDLLDEETSRAAEYDTPIKSALAQVAAIKAKHLMARAQKNLQEFTAVLRGIEDMNAQEIERMLTRARLEYQMVSMDVATLRAEFARIRTRTSSRSKQSEAGGTDLAPPHPDS